MSRPLVLVAYRDRETHLKCFSLYMKNMYPELTVAIIEQDNTLPWNKGILFNIGYKWFADNYDYIILHDVDFIPVKGKVDYGPCEVPTCIATQASQFNYTMLYPQFFGGAIVLSKQHFKQVNGFSNKFRGWGGEDDLFYKSFTEQGIQPQCKNGYFECFAHPRPVDAYYQHNLELLYGKESLDKFRSVNPQRQYPTHAELNNLKLFKNRRDLSEGLSTVDFHVTGQSREANIIHLKVDFNN